MATPIKFGSKFGGYEYRFVNDPPDELICKICHHPCREPYLSGCCGHNFCKSCLDAAKRTATNCPFCRNNEFATLANKLSDRKIQSLHVMCTNKERGCEWQGELNAINDHLNGCQFEGVKCSNKCGKMLQRRYLTSHVDNKCPRRKVDCQYCHITGQHQYIEGEHKKQCPKLPLPCPNKCKVGSVPREDMEAHKKECPFEIINCTNKCFQRLQRQHMTAHVMTKCPRRKVDCQYCHITGEHQFIQGEHKKQCPKFLLPCPNKCHNHGHTRCARMMVTQIPREDMESHLKVCLLQLVKCSLSCEKELQRQDLKDHVDTECPRRKVDCQYCHITGEHQFIEGEHKEQCPKFPLLCPNKCEVGSVPREDMEAHKKECPYEMIDCSYRNVGCEERMIRKDLDKHKSDYMEDHLSLTESKLADATSQLSVAVKQINTLMVLVHHIASNPSSKTKDKTSIISTAKYSVKLNAMAEMGKCGDQVCPVVLNVTEFSKKATQLQIEFTASFYSHNKGYKMCLCVYPAGHGSGKGTHLSVATYLMEGPHDDELTWPLRKRFEVKLLNQISDCEHHSETVTYDDYTPDEYASKTKRKRAKVGWGNSQFISNENLHKVTPTCQYLKDDCIFLQVSKL